MWADQEEGSPPADEEEESPQADEEEGSPQADEEEGSQAIGSPAASIEVDLRADSRSPSSASPGCCPALRACGKSIELRADGSGPKLAASPDLAARAATDRAGPRSPDDDRILQGRPFFVKLECSVKHACWYQHITHC